MPLTDAQRESHIYSSEGSAGLTMFFHGNLFHASANNLSARDRMSIFVSYNSVENKLRDIDHPRPAFIASRDFTPQTPVPDDALLKMEVGGNGQGS